MELHDLISLNQLNDFNESPIDVPDSFIKEINKKSKFESTYLNCYENKAFMSTECLDNQFNHSKETFFNDFFIEDSIDGEKRFRTVSFDKKINEPLGITIKNDRFDGVIIGRIIKGGLAEQCGQLSEGDEILKINQIEMKGRNINEISDALSKTSGKLTFVIKIKNKDNFLLRTTDSELNLRALFDYNPENDSFIPCKEAGIHFKKGQVLHVIDQTDTNWWQANLDINGNCSLAGLIPSNHFQIMRNSVESTKLIKKSNKMGIFCGKNKKKKAQKKLNNLNKPVYEKVSLLYPNKSIKRPIVLVGPTNLGIFELRKLLIQNDDRFAVPVPHTTRKKKLEEIDGYDYHFCSQNEFDLQIKDNRLIEFGKYQDDFYGLSIGSILGVIQSGKICLLNLNASSIEKIRAEPIGPVLKPYFIFITASNNQIDDLQELKIIEESMKINMNYGQYFDHVIVRTTLDETFKELLNEIHNVETKPKWVPVNWLSHNYN